MNEFLSFFIQAAGYIMAFILIALVILFILYLLIKLIRSIINYLRDYKCQFCKKKISSKEEKEGMACHLCRNKLNK